MFLPPEVGDRAEFLTELVRQTVPSVDYFLFSILSGLVLGLALLLDAPALVFLAVLAAPFMAPVVGISLGTLTGSNAYILQSLGSLGIGSLIVFVCGALAGIAAPLLPVSGSAQALLLNQFNWAKFLVLLVGAALAGYHLVRAPEQKPLVPGLAIAYGLYLPLGAAGYSLASGMGSLWLDGLVLFFIHLVWAVFTGALVLALLGIRPLHTRGYVMGAVYGLCGVLLVLLVSPPLWNPDGPGQAGIIAGESTQPAAEGGEETQPALQAPTPSPSPSFTITPPPSATPTQTQQPSLTPTATLTLSPTPAVAIITASEGGGALIRVEPNFDANAVTSVINGMPVQVLPDPVQDGSITWLRVRLPDGREGWILQSLLRMATPAPAAP